MSFYDNKAVKFKSCPVAQLPKTALVQLVTNSGPMPKERNRAGKEIHFYYILAVSTELLAVSANQKKKKKTEVMF